MTPTEDTQRILDIIAKHAGFNPQDFRTLFPNLDPDKIIDALSVELLKEAGINAAHALEAEHGENLDAAHWEHLPAPMVKVMDQANRRKIETEGRTRMNLYGWIVDTFAELGDGENLLPNAIGDCRLPQVAAV